MSFIFVLFWQVIAGFSRRAALDDGSSSTHSGFVPRVGGLAIYKAYSANTFTIFWLYSTLSSTILMQEKLQD